MKGLESVKPRERVGSATYNKFKFQIAFAIERLLELASKNKDFWLLMDYLEDVVTIEKYGEDTSIISFYQVKSKERNAITIGNVISEKFLDKMHYNISEFRNHDCNAFLVTNCGISFNKKIVNDAFNVNLNDYLDKKSDTGNKTNDAKDDEYRLKKKKEIIKSISELEGIKEEDVDLSKFFLLTTTLTLNDYDRQIDGSFSEYMETFYPKLTAQSVQTVKAKIWSDMDKKNAFVIGNNTTDEKYIVGKKGVTRKTFDEIIDMQRILQFPTYSDLSEFSAKYCGEFGKTPLRDKELYDKFQSDCAFEERKTLSLVYEILKYSHNDFINARKNELLNLIEREIEQDSRVASLGLYGKYKELFHIVALYKMLED